MSNTLTLLTQSWLPRTFDDGHTYLEVTAIDPSGLSVYILIKSEKFITFTVNDKSQLTLLKRVKQLVNVTSYKITDNALSITTPDDIVESGLTKYPSYNLFKEDDPLTTFFVSTGISPYSIVNVSNFTEIVDDNNIDYSIMVDSYSSFSIPDEIDVVIRDNRARAYWDHEVMSENVNSDSIARPFPQWNRPNDEIFMTSIILRDGTSDYTSEMGYILTIKEPDFEVPENTIVEILDDEKSLVKRMWEIFSVNNVYRNYTYNGLGFDIPYTADRMRVGNFDDLPQLGVDSDPAQFAILNYRAKFGSRQTLLPIAVGYETIDMLLYFQHFYPFLPNHKLETVGQYIIGQGKTGLPIEDLFVAYETNDAKKIGAAADYALQDSVLLALLEEAMYFEQEINQIANGFKMTVEDFLTSTPIDLVIQASFVVNPLNFLSNLSFALFNTVKSNEFFKKGIYSDVHIYDYSMVYLDIMRNSGDPFVISLSNILLYGINSSEIIRDRGTIRQWPELVATMFYSPYISESVSTSMRAVLKSRLLDTLDQLRLDGTLIFQNHFSIRTRIPLYIDSVELIQRAAFFMSVTKSSYLIGNDIDNLTCHGRSIVCKQKFPLATTYVNNYINFRYNNIDKYLTYTPNADELPRDNIDDYVLTYKISSTSSINDMSLSIQEQVREILGYEPDFEYTVKYVMVKTPSSQVQPANVNTISSSDNPSSVSLKYKTIPKLINNISSEDEIDYDYYRKILFNIRKNINSIRDYRNVPINNNVASSYNQSDASSSRSIVITSNPSSSNKLATMLSNN